MTPDDPQLILLHQLADGEWVSGADLAQTLGISREAVSKRVRRLSEWQLEVASQSGRGYQLRPAIELLEGANILAGLRAAGHEACDVRILTSVDSSNRWLAEHGDNHMLCLTEHQSAGRGRRGRHWHSPFGQNLYLSLRVDFNQWPEKLPALGLVLGVAICERLARFNIPMQLKWPNDLYLSGKKCGGLLIEQRGELHGTGTLIIGLGLNVAMRDDQAIDQHWTSLALQGHAISRNALAVAVADTLLHECRELDNQRISMRLSQFSAHDVYRDAAVQIESAQGIIPGQTLGIDEWGRLRLLTDRGEQLFSVGDVSLRASHVAD